MTYSIWNDLCQQPMPIASSGKYTKLVQDSTVHLQQPIDSIMSTLNDRAIGLSKCVNFIAALQDAKLMQHLSPASALGYLREASIYCDQGKQHHVIDICNKGLNMALTKDSDYAILQQAKNHAEECHATCIDFIRQLPLDLVISLLVPMFVEDDCMDGLKPSPALYVSYLWRERIIQSLGGLRFWIRSEGGKTLAALMEFAPHIKVLAIQQYTKGTWLGDLIGDNHFSSLLQLDIEKFTSMYIGRFLSSLKSVSSTLTHFDVDMEGGPMLSVPKVVHYALPLQKPITCDHVIEVWKRFPSLEELELSPCTNVQPALVAPEYYPAMTSVGIFMEGASIRLVYLHEEVYKEESGMSKIVIDTEDFGTDICKDTSSVVKRHHNTLKHLEWDMDTSHDIETIDNIQFPRLTKLCLFSCGWQIIRNAPMLEELALTVGMTSMHPQVLDTMPPNLKSLDLDLNSQHAYDDDDDSPILCYLNRIAIQMRLKKLVIHFNSCNNVAFILDAIHRHDHLECLKIRFTGEWVSIQCRAS
ncbi:hypothetical protein O0I10_006294 [Lichtheimia ornata]|uniref:Uncharacterized protein n=1 Tax=Lichtheimia ornata TaxID=688661 RepID=A0AAD7V291_9FUNG|nr:uncharacterized protein O0I10_006294 [Lichtheimia ornata]KAJ8658023.1 hypothetical protein O0I10_006294 [Lichtheimia ornata]